MLHLSHDVLTHLNGKKNLLAFSAGVDSSSLFFLLLEHNIFFDIAIINYNTREDSNKEQSHAYALAQEHNLKCHSLVAPTFNANFEKNARDFRYKFFEKLIEEYAYDNILTGHQLNDQLEWLLMRLTKGAGVSELVGLQSISKRATHNLIRPLLSYSKDELLEYLDQHNYPYFIDSSNIDEKYERNLFRNRFSDELISKYRDGIKRSFDYLKDDKSELESGFELIYKVKDLRVVRVETTRAKVKASDLVLKELGYLISSAQREEIAKNDTLVIGATWSVEYVDSKLYISPYTKTVMDKKFKERCRVAGTPLKIRAYCYTHDIEVEDLP